jgi:hypothetical protein
MARFPRRLNSTDMWGVRLAQDGKLALSCKSGLNRYASTDQGFLMYP